MYPSPVSDRGIGRPPYNHESCACVDTTQLDYWFGDVVDYLDGYHAKILKLSVPRHAVIIGDKQVLFDRQCAKVVETYPAHRLPELTGRKVDNQLQLPL
jgi:hypothetical protein